MQGLSWVWFLPGFKLQPSSSFLTFMSLFLRSALNKLFSAVMANTFQSVSRNLFNLISSVLISPKPLLVVVWLTSLTAFLHHKKSKQQQKKKLCVYKICRPEKDLTVFMLDRAPALRCLRRSQAGGYTSDTHPHVSWVSSELSQMFCYLTQQSFTFALRLLSTLVPRRSRRALFQSQRHPEVLCARLNPETFCAGTTLTQADKPVQQNILAFIVQPAGFTSF